MANGFTDTRSFDAADVDKDEKLKKDDITQLQNFIKLSAKEFTETPVTKPAPAALTEPADDPG